MSTVATPSGTRAAEPASRRSAEERAKQTATRNIPSLPDLPAPADTANLRLGEDISPAMLALLFGTMAIYFVAQWPGHARAATLDPSGPSPGAG